jgi:hypothetical protein
MIPDGVLFPALASLAVALLLAIAKTLRDLLHATERNTRALLGDEEVDMHEGLLSRVDRLEQRLEEVAERVGHE